MIKKYTNLLTPEQCESASRVIKAFYRISKSSSKESTKFTGGTTGFYDNPKINSLLPYIEPVVKQDYGQDIKFVNSFTRVYSNENYLKIHTDRADLDVTLSVCIYNNTGIKWPMYVSEYERPSECPSKMLEQYLDEIKSKAKPYTTDIGDALVCLGTKNPHWRDTLVCDPDAIIIQAFYHWRFV